jgi:hypothetical protein
MAKIGPGIMVSFDLSHTHDGSDSTNDKGKSMQTYRNSFISIDLCITF